MSLPPGTQLGSYRIIARIGAGGMGEVYRAHDEHLDRDVAIKVLPEAFAEDKERVRRFEQEAHTLAKLSHPSIVQIFDLGEHGGSPFLVMELLAGETLRKLLLQGRLPWRKAVELGVAMADALAAAHAKGIVHRDLKPENVMVDEDGHLKLLDFGLAKLRPALLGAATTLDASEAGTMAGTLLGTVGYMSPEQIQGFPVDARSDLFALGAVLYEMVTGRRAFEGHSALEVLSAILKDPVPAANLSVSGASPGLDRLLAHCLEKAPGDRFQSAKELLLALRALLGTREEGRLPGAGKVLRVTSVLAAVGLVAALAGASLWLGLHRAPVRRPSLVALPTKVVGPDASAFLADAIPDTLSTLVSGVEGLDTKIPPTSAEVEQVKGDLGKIGKVYGVDHLLLTSATVRGDLILLNVQLVATGTRKVLWGSQFEGSMETYNVFLRQTAEAVTAALGKHPAPSQPPLPASEVGLALAEGRHFGEAYARMGRMADHDLAVGAYERALKLEPRCAAGASGLALLLRTRSLRTREEGLLPKARAQAMRALDLDPKCPEAWSALTSIEADLGNLQGSVTAALKAVHLAADRPSALMLLGNAVSDPGSSALYLALEKRALERDPMHPEAALYVVEALLSLGRPAEALETADQALTVLPGKCLLQVKRAQALIDLGRLDEAEGVLRRWRGEAFQGLPWIRESWVQIQFALVAARGDPVASQAQGRELVERYVSPRTDIYTLGFGAYVMVPRLLRLGLVEEALRLLESHLAKGGASDLDWLWNTPELRKLQGNPRFQRVLRSSRDFAAVIVTCFDQAKALGELPGYLEPALMELRALVNRPIETGNGRS